jgi:hypothetical protein
VVDTRLRGEWLHTPRFDDLSNEAWRLFTLAMMWSNEQGTDGVVPVRYLKVLHPSVDPERISELETAGLVDITDEEIRFGEWSRDLGQSTAQEVEGRRENARKRQREWRERQAVKSGSETDDVTRDVTRYVGTGLGSEAKANPEAYVTRNETCPKHPVDNGEKCGTCMRIRLDREARRPAAGGEDRAIAARCKREGHLFNAGDLYCNRCGQKRDPNAWMQPDDVSSSAHLEPVSNDTPDPVPGRSFPPVRNLTPGLEASDGDAETRYHPWADEPDYEAYNDLMGRPVA